MAMVISCSTVVFNQHTAWRMNIGLVPFHNTFISTISVVIVPAATPHTSKPSPKPKTIIAACILVALTVNTVMHSLPTTPASTTAMSNCAWNAAGPVPENTHAA